MAYPGGPACLTSARVRSGEARALPASQGERELESEDERVGDASGSAGIDDVLKVRLHLQPLGGLDDIGELERDLVLLDPRSAARAPGIAL